MPEQDILFLLSGDAQGAVDALTSLIDAVGLLDEALMALAGSLTALNETEALLAALGADEAGVAAVADALLNLGTGIDDSAASAPLLAQGLADIAIAEDAVVASASAVAQVMNDQASALVADAQAAGDAAAQSVALVAADDALVSSVAAVAQSASDMVAYLTAEDVALGLTADQANLFIDALMRAGGTEAEAIGALDAYTASVLAAGAAVGPLAAAEDAVAASTALMSESFVVATEAETLMAIAQANAMSGFTSFGAAADTAAVAEDAQSAAALADAAALDELDAVFASMMVALSEGSNMFTAVNDALNLMGDAGVTADVALGSLEQAAITLGISLGDVLQGVSDINTIMDSGASSTDIFAMAFDAADAALSAFQATASTVASTVSGATDALSGMAVAEDEVAAAGTNKNRVMGEQAAATQGDAYMILVLLQFLLQAARGFVTMGTAAQDSIAKLSGLADQSLAGASGLTRLNGVISTLEADSIKFGIGLKQASDGLYFIMSGGFNTADALTILSYSMKASSATGATLTSMGGALVSILNSYGLTAKSAGLITNEMIQSIVSGRMPSQDYANAIGNLASVAHQTGFSFVEATSALSTFTQVNQRTRQDAQNLANTFVVLGTESSKIAKVAKGLGIAFDETAFKSMDLKQKLDYLAQIAGGDNTTAFRALLLNATAARTAFELLANNGKNLTTVLTAVAGNTHALDVAFAESEKTVTAASNHMHAALSVLAYQLIVLATPIVSAFFGALTTALTFLTQHMNVLIPVITALAIIIGGLMVSALGAMAGMMAPIVMESLALFGPLALIAAIVVIVVQALQHLASVSPPVAAAFAALGKQFSAIGAVLGGMFNTQMQSAGKALQQFGAWAMTNVVPAVIQLVLHLTAFVSLLASGIVPVVHGLGTAITVIASAFSNSAHAVSSFVSGSQPLQHILQAVWKNFTDLWGVLVSQIGPILAQLKETLQAQIIPAWNQLSNALSHLGPYLQFLGVVVGGILVVAFTLLVSIIRGVIVGLGQFLQGAILVVGGVIQVFAGLVSFFVNLISLIVAVFHGNWNEVGRLTYQMGENLRMIWLGLWNALMGILQAVFGTIIGFVVGFVQGVIGFFQHLGDRLVGHSIWPDMWNAVLNFFTGWVTSILGHIGAFVASVVTWFVDLGTRALAAWTTMTTSIWNSVTAWIMSILLAIGNWELSVIMLFVRLGAQALSAMQSAWNNLTSAVRAGIANVISAVTGFVAQVGNIFKGLIASALNWGAGLMNGFANGIKGAVGAVTGAASWVAGQVAALLHHSTPDTGPLAGDDQWMPHFGDMLASGLNDQVTKVGRAASNIATGVRLATPTSGDIASYSSPASSVTQSDPAILQVLQAILAELKNQGGSNGNNSMVIGHNIPSSALGAVTPSFGGSGSVVSLAHERYQQLNVLAGIAFENGVRGASTGLGV